MNLSNSMDMKRLTQFWAAYEKSSHCKSKNHYDKPVLVFWTTSFSKYTATVEGVKLALIGL